MDQDPYTILGVSRDASDEEIKTAYRNLAKKYHPDRNPDDPNAAEKMNQINAAYDAIKDGAANYYSQGNGYSSSAGYNQYSWSQNWNPFGGSYQQAYQQTQERSEYQAAYHFIVAAHYQEALNALSGVPSGERTGRWYYLSSVANSRLGNRIQALEHARIAAEMEPNNSSYQQLYAMLQQNGVYYQSYTTGNDMSMPSSDRLCTSLCLASVCCSLCGGGNFFLCC